MLGIDEEGTAASRQRQVDSCEAGGSTSGGGGYFVLVQARRAGAQLPLLTHNVPQECQGGGWVSSLLQAQRLL